MLTSLRSFKKHCVDLFPVIRRLKNQRKKEIAPTFAVYNDLKEAYTTLKIQNNRLVEEVTRLKTEITDLNYKKLKNSTKISPEPKATKLNHDTSLVGSFLAILNDPSNINPETIISTILKLIKDERLGEAELLIQLAVRQSPGFSKQHMRWVRQLRCHKLFDLAILVANISMEVNGDLEEIRLNRGYLYYEAGQYASAVTDLEIAAKNRPNSVEEKLISISAKKKAGQEALVSQKKLLDNFFNPAKVTFSARQIKSKAIKESLERYGCAWIKGLFDPKELTHFDNIISANIENIQTLFQKLELPPSFSAVGFPLYFASIANPELCHQIYEQSYPGIFDPNKMPGVDNNPLAKFVFSNLQRVGLDAVIREYLNMQRLYVSAASCHIRSMVPTGVKAFGEFHQDNRLYNSDAEILTLWFPFRYQHGPMPSLEFLPVRSDSHFPCVSVCGIDNELFDADVFWRPEYELGDAMLLSGFSPHRTYFEPHMDLERTSIDFRFFASPLPEPIYEDEPSRI